MNALIPQNQNNSLITQRDITLLSPVIATYGSIENFCKVYAQSAHCPTHLQNKPVEIQLMIAYGLCFGLAPFAAIKNVMVLNNIPSLYGDAVTAMCYATRQLRKLQVDIKHTDDVIPNLEINGKPAKNIIATCNIIREGIEEITTSFSLIEANEAGLLFSKDRSGREYPKVVWHKYTTRMLAWRAKTYAIREAFPDKLVGLTTFEELIDYPDVNYDGEIIFNENGSARLAPSSNKPVRNTTSLPRKQVINKTNNHNNNSNSEYIDVEHVSDYADFIDVMEEVDDKETQKFKKQIETVLNQFENSSAEQIEKRTEKESYQSWISKLQSFNQDLFDDYNQRLTRIIDDKMKEIHGENIIDNI